MGLFDIDEDDAPFADQRKNVKVVGDRRAAMQQHNGAAVDLPSNLPQKDKSPLTDRFGYPPFTVLNARDRVWQQRKRWWAKAGIHGEEGRVADTNGDGDEGRCYNTGAPGDLAQQFKQKGKKEQHLAPGGGGGGCWLGGKATSSTHKFATGRHAAPLGRGKNSCYQNAAGVTSTVYKEKDDPSHQANRGGIGSLERYDDSTKRESSGTSVFDPVLCELMYSWFCPPGGRVLDPFAGESTKGIVAAMKGYDYTGVELRAEQVKANNRQAKVCGVRPTWVQGDSAKLKEVIPANPKFDFVWTSPPYYDLEVYSSKEEDGSAFSSYAKFMAWYERIFKQAVFRLADDRFLAVKIGEVRDEKGVYRNFVGDNIACFTRLGLHYWNELILVTAVGSLPIRVGKQFSTSRKAGKSHQQCLVFWKGDPANVKKKVKEWFPNEPTQYLDPE